MLPQHAKLEGPVEQNDHVRTSVSVKTLTVSSIEELNTRSMSLSARPCDLLVTGGSHVSEAISSRLSSPRQHFGARARTGLRSGERDRTDTVSTMEHSSSNAVARGKGWRLAQVSQRTRRHRKRSCSDLRRGYHSRSRVCSDPCRTLTGTWRRRAAMSPSKRRWKRSKRASVSGTPVRFGECAPAALKKSFYWTL